MEKKLLNNRKKAKNIISVFYLAFIILLYLVPIFLKNQYTLHLLIISCIYIILASSLNLITGYMGAFSLGHAAFYGIGAYTSALLAINLSLPFWITIWPGVLLAAFFGLILGIPSLKLKTSYLAITTIAFGNIVYLLLLNLVRLTKGPLGLVGIPAPTPIKIGNFVVNFNTKGEYYHLVLTFMLIVLFFLNRLINSRTGRAIVSLKEDDIAAEALGVDVRFFKILTFVVGTGIAGLAGSLYAHYVGFISPESFNILTSIQILVMVIFGGLGTLYGPIIGAVGVTFLLEKLRFLSSFRLIIYGILLFIVVFYMPKGIIGFVQQKFEQKL